MTDNSQKRIAIFTNFNSADPAYSLNRVVQDQIKMFTRGGYTNIKVVVAQGFKAVDAYKDVELVEIPNVPCHNQIKKDETFDQDVEGIYQAIEEKLSDVDVVLTHDIIYQPACLKHNFAARKFAANHKNVKWLHWIHSATAPYKLNSLLNIFEDKYLELIKKEFPNSFYIFFNNYSIPRIAENFGVEEEKVKIVHHPIDLNGFFGSSPLVTKFVEEKKLYEADAVCVYPCRLDRGKQVQMAIKTMGMLKEFGMSVRMIVIDFHSTGGDKVVYRDELKEVGIDYGLNPRELSFTSDFCEEWKAQMPHTQVKEIMMFMNVMIMPSVSESYSLVAQEAAAMGAVLVLNQDFFPFRDIFGPNAIYRKYSAGIDTNGMDGWTGTDYGPTDASPEERPFHERVYHRITAGKIAYRLRNYDNFAIQRKIFKERNLDTIFKKELEPLIYS